MQRIQAWTRPTLWIVIALVPLLAALWVSPILPTHDGPKTLYASHVRFHLDDPAFAREFAPSYPVTSVGFTLVYGALERALSWRLAYGVTWTFVVLTLPFGLVRLARAMHEDRAALGLVGIAGAVHWAVHMGFANYVASIGLGFSAIAFGLEKEAWSPRRELAVYLTMAAGAVFHPVGAQMAAVSLFVYRVLGARRGRRIREIGAIVLAVVPALAITVVTRDTLEDLRLQGLAVGRTVDLDLRQRLASFVSYFISGPRWRVVPLLVLALAGVASTVVSFAKRRFDRRTLALFAVCLVGVVGVATAPMDSASWQYMEPRFIPLAIFPACMLVPLERLSARARAAVTGCLFVLAVASNLWVYREHARWAEASRASLSALGRPAEPGHTLLPILATPENSWAYQHDDSRPIAAAARDLNLGQVYGVDRRAIVPYTFSFLPGIHPIVQKRATMPHVPVRDYGEYFADDADPVTRRRELVRLASFGTEFDDVLFVGAEDDAATFVSLGYETEARDEGFFIGHFVGCPLDVHVEGASHDGGMTVGWAPAERVVAELAVGPTTPGVHHLDRASCGGMWVRLFAGEGEHCRGADREGYLSAAPGARELVCIVER
jgi:hypothetical protein